MENNQKGFWTKITKSDQYRAINDLIVESQSGSTYYTLLVLSSIVIAAGLLLANSAILIGGMLITPLLTPILLFSLGVTTGRPLLIKRTAILILKSMGVVFVVAFMAGIVFSTPEDKEFFSSSIFNDTIKAAFLYFIVAFASGIAATFAWIRKKVDSMLPGISVAVSLVPPIALVAIWIAELNFDTARFFLMVFLFNMIGIIMGSMIVFSMLRFYRADDAIEASLNKVVKEEVAEKKKMEEEVESDVIEKLDDKTEILKK